MYWKKNLLLIPVTEKKTKVFVFTTFSPSNKWMCGGFSQYYYLELSYKKNIIFGHPELFASLSQTERRKTKFLSWSLKM